MSVKLTLVEVTERRNGYNMPIVKVKSDVNLTIINRGYNTFESIEEIDESDLLKLRELLPNENKAHLEIETPERNTCAWYCIQSDNIGNERAKLTNNIIW